MANDHTELTPQEQLANVFDGLAEDVLNGHIPVDKKDIERASKVFSNVEQILNSRRSAPPADQSDSWADRTGREELLTTGKLK